MTIERRHEVAQTTLKFCPDHWQKLRHEVESRGLGKLVAGDAVEASRRATAWPLAQTIANFEPAIGAQMLILENVVKAVGPRVLQPNPATGEPYCPVCELAATHKVKCLDPACAFDGDSWLGLAAEAQLKTYQALLAREQAAGQ